MKKSSKHLKLYKEIFNKVFNLKKEKIEEIINKKIKKIKK